MFFNDRFPFRTAHKLADQLARHGITPPAPVTEAMARLIAIEADKPAKPAANTVEKVFWNGGSPKQLDQAAHDILTHPAKLEGWEAARHSAGIAAVDEFHAAAAELTAALRKLASPLIEKLSRYAALDQTLEHYVSVGDHTSAELIATIDVTATALGDLYALRGELTPGGTYGDNDLDCGTWRNPLAVRDAHFPSDITRAQSYRIGIKAGGDLWFPTVADAAEAARVIRDAHRAEFVAAELAEHQRNQELTRAMFG